GLSVSVIRSCAVKCTLSGEKYVGGIVGSGVSEALSGGSSLVAGCCSMVSIEACQEFAGAVSGADAGDFTENYFVSDTLAGINGRSRSGQAEPLSYEELLLLGKSPADDASSAGLPESPDGKEAADAEDTGNAEDAEGAENAGTAEDAENADTDAEEAETDGTENAADDGEEAAGDADEAPTEAAEEADAEPLPISVPDAFREFTLTFLADGEVIRTLSFAYGASFDESVFPDIPEKEGHYAHWDRTELRELHFDTVVTAVYTPYVTALSNTETRAGGRPIFFIEGQFDDEVRASVTAQPSTPGDFDVLAEGWKDFLAKGLSDSTVSREVVEQWRITIPDDGQDMHTVRYLSPDADPEHLDVYVRQDGGWQKTDAESIGSYLAFPVEGTEAEIAVLSTVNVWWLRLLAGLALLALLALLVLLAVRIGRHMLTMHPAQTAAAPDANPPDAAEAVSEPRVKKRWLTPLLVVLALLAGIGGTAAFFLLPDLLTDVQAYDLLKEYAQQEELSMSLTVNASVGSEDVSFSAEADRLQEDGRRITAISRDGCTLYYTDGAVFLENGKAYKLSDDFPDYTRLPEQAAELYRYVDIDKKDGVYTITAEGSDAETVLRLLIPSSSGVPVRTASLQIELRTDDGEVTELRFSGNGMLDDAGKTSLRVSAVLTLRESGKRRVSVPSAVLEAVRSGDYEASEPLTDDLLRIAEAWRTLHRSKYVSADMRLEADCGPVSLSETLRYCRWNDGNLVVGSVRKNGLALYFTEGTVCDKNGMLLPSADTSPAESAKLLDIAYQACMNAGLDCEAEGERYTYTVSLDEDGMKAVACAIAPALRTADLRLDSGTLRLVVENGSLQSITLRCDGSIQVALTLADAAVEAQIDFRNDGAAELLPDAARDTLKSRESLV
ncbi:MAG: hypothetical protein ACI4QB_09200, partial [Eubacteriales bacterium]